MALQLSIYFQAYSVSTLCDDCFLLFRSLDHVPLFLNYLNYQHPNISFTSELEKDGKLPFLDVDITRSNGKFSTSVYRKPNFTGLFTNFHSFIPLAHKRSLISCLIYRIFNLCSIYENSHTQLEVIRKLFNLNGFPSHRFDRLVHRFLNKIFEAKPPIHTVPKKVAVDAVPRRMWVKPCAFTHQSIGIPGTHSYITGQPSSGRVMSSMFSHINTTGHSANFDDFKILSSSSDTCELLIHESLFISKLKPTLNVQGSSNPLNLLQFNVNTRVILSSLKMS